MKPLHPVLVHFPLALLPVSVLADALATLAGVASLRPVGWWAMAAAAAGAAAAAAAGWYDMTRASLDEPVHHRVHRHRRFGLALLAALVGLAVWRGVMEASDRFIPMLYLDLAALTVALAVFQGWLGGELVYADGVFVRQGQAEGEQSGHKH